MMISRFAPALMALALLVVSCAQPAESAPSDSQVVAELADSKNHPFYGEYMTVEWAQKWPSEEMWRARKR